MTSLAHDQLKAVAGKRPMNNQYCDEDKLVSNNQKKKQEL